MSLFPFYYIKHVYMASRTLSPISSTTAMLPPGGATIGKAGKILVLPRFGGCKSKICPLKDNLFGCQIDATE